MLNNIIGKYSSESGESSSVCGLDHETKTTKKNADCWSVLRFYSQKSESAKVSIQHSFQMAFGPSTSALSFEDLQDFLECPICRQIDNRD